MGREMAVTHGMKGKEVYPDRKRREKLGYKMGKYLWKNSIQMT